MFTYIVKRLLLTVPTLVGVSVVAFLMIHLIPGNIVEVMLGTRTDVTAAQIRELDRLYGINRPLWAQYLAWIGQLLHGNLGFSLRTGLPITQLIGSAFAVTAELAVGALLVAVLIAIPLGVFAALHRGTAWDFAIRAVGLVGLSIPNFWLGTMVVLWTALYLPVLSSFTFVSLWSDPLLNLRDMLVPVFTLAVSLVAITLRMTRAAVLETLGRDHVRTARAKGMTPARVNLRHVLRNSLIPVLTIVGLQMGYLLGGAIVVENVFSLPGIGRLLVSAINERDYPLVQASVLFVAAVFVLVNLVVDVLYAFANPEIKVQ